MRGEGASKFPVLTSRNSTSTLLILPQHVGIPLERVERNVAVRRWGMEK